jgi:hypothetical protein
LSEETRLPSHVAIVGCGFTGTTALHQLVRHYPVRRVTVFESSGKFGPGFPYAEDESREYLLNNTNDTMCLEPSNRRAFVEWLHEHPVYARDLDEKASMPRAVYGEFLRDVIAKSVALAVERGIAVEFVPDEVVDLDERDGGVMLSTANDSFAADLAILATGRCPDADVYDLSDAPADRYFPVHMPGTRLDTIPLDAECHVLGSSLSAYDVVNQLFGEATGCRFVPDGPNRRRYEANGNQRSIVLCSRGGRLKKVQTRNPCGVKPKHFSLDALRASSGAATLERIMELMKTDARAHGVDIDWQQLAEPYADCTTADALNTCAREMLAADIDAAASPADSNANFIVEYLDAVQFVMWDIFAAHILSPDGEATFRRQYESPLLTFAAPCPPLTAQKVLALMDAGRLRVVAGVESVALTADGATMEIAHSFGKEQAGYLVNASGIVDRRLASDRQPPLIANLYRKGLLQEYRGTPGAANGVDVDMQSFESTGSPKLLVANMFLWGPGLYVSAAIVMATIVKQLLDYAFGGPRIQAR